MRAARSLFAVALLVASSAAWGQSTLLQGGAVTPGHVPMYVNSGTSQAVVQDSGPAGGGGVGLGLSEFLQANRTTTGTGPLGTHSCFLDNATTNPGGYHYFCLDANAQGGGLLAYGAGGAASPLPLTFNVNGVPYQFPFSIGGVVGPSVSAVDNAACWNNTVGTLLKDCGPFVTVGGNNTWTGTNNYTGPFQILGAVQTFPPSGSIVGTSDAQTLTNKHINASEVDSGTFPGTVMPAYTGDVASPAGSTVNTIQPGVVTNASLAAAGSANTVKGAASSTAVTDLAMPSCSSGVNALQWASGTGFQCGTLAANTAGWGVSIAGGGTISISTTAPPFPYDLPVNMGLSASAAGSALTISIKTASGADPSASSPVLIPFRSTTAATGTISWTAITAPLSIVIPSAATLGTQSSNVPFRIWIFATYNGGVPQLGVALCSSSTTIYPCSSWDAALQTTTAVSGFSTSAGVLYATAGVSNDAVRIIGYATYSTGVATAGSWSAGPTGLHVMSPTMKRPGDVIQTVSFSTSTSGTTTSASFVTLTNSPTASITNNNPVNLIRHSISGTVAGTTTAIQLVRVQRGSTPIGNSVMAAGNGSLTAPFGYVFYDTAVGTNPSYSFQGETSAGTLSVPNSSAGLTWVLEEIMGALDAPANDNVNPGVYSQTG